MQMDPLKVAVKLAEFTIANNFDGVNIDYNDIPALQSGTAEAWLIFFFQELREKLPDHTIVATVKPSFCNKDHYSGGAYEKINQQVGHLIDFYNVEYYTEEDTEFNTYNQIFIESIGSRGGTAVEQLVSNHGFQRNKIIVGKTASSTGLYNIGCVPPADLGSWTEKHYLDKGWYGGVSFW